MKTLSKNKQLKSQGSPSLSPKSLSLPSGQNTNMLPLDKAIQEQKTTLAEFREITIRILAYLPNVLSEYFEKDRYRVYSSKIAGSIKYIRPINQQLFIHEIDVFEARFEDLKRIMAIVSSGGDANIFDKKAIDSVLYTIQQALGAAFDLLTNPNSARKHVGNRFEELMKAFFTELGIANKRIVLQIPYETEDGHKNYKCENDLILSPHAEVQSSNHQLNEKEVVVSVKTTSKDRMGKMFIDKMLLQRFVQRDQKVIGIFLHDVQRKGDHTISYTLVSNLFMVYSKFLVELDGIYFLDPPPVVAKSPFNQYMRPFSELIIKDLKTLLTT